MTTVVSQEELKALFYQKANGLAVSELKRRHNKELSELRIAYLNELVEKRIKDD